MRSQDTLQFKAITQPDTVSRIEVLGMYQDNAVKLRWAPNQSIVWFQLVKSGYQIERFLLNESNVPDMSSRKSWKVQPWSLEQFRPYINSNRNALLIAGQCMYGEWESMKSKDPHLFARADELSNRFGVAMLAADMDWEASVALGLGWNDAEAQSGQTYLYTVSPLDTTAHVHTAYLSVLCVEGPVPSPVIQHVIEYEGTVTLQWNRHDHEPYFSAYHIERSTNGVTFDRLLDIPFVGGMTKEYPSSYFSYTDSVANYKPYFYRIVGVTPFATLSSPSPVRKAMGKDKTPPSTIRGIQVLCDEAKREIKLSWEPSSTSDLTTYSLFRSDRIDGAWEDVTKNDLDPDKHMFKERVNNTQAIHYYQIAVKDTAGNTNVSLPIVAAFRDTISPLQPTGLKGVIDTNGMVTLQWNLGPDRDLRGYYVYVSNQADQFFTNVTPRPISDTIWRDTITLKVFTEKIYYKVAAVDFHSHFSVFSEPLELNKPDTIRPFSPHFKHYRVERDFIRLEMVPSESKDVWVHQLWKRPEGAEWLLVSDFSIMDSTYLDRSIEEGRMYEYKLIAIDDAGLECRYPEVIRIKAVDLSQPDAPLILSCLFSGDHEVYLEWKNQSTQPYGYQIYRSVNNGPFVTIDKVTNGASYSDTSIRALAAYQYKIRTLWKDGRKSAFSEIATPIREQK